ncbi:glycoside hydrolase family 44 protein [Nocardioides sp.]|uniref:glycoside hydrolase family 44 protein n=1 Tax=Nocardioides sp. TaxID=35761 RepID=UPI0031FED270|nr:Endoglucanase precursor [Nocardioides sp.]
MRRWVGLVSLGVAAAWLPFVSRADAMPVDAPVPVAVDRGAVRAPSVTLRVDAAAGRHRISNDIYGINFADEALANSINLPVDRWGGDSTESYNWQINGGNEGINYYFQNFPDCWIPAFDYCTTGHSYSGALALIEKDRRVGAKTLLNLPALGWVAKSVTYDQDQLCSYPANVFDPQDDHDTFHPVCGNGRRNGQWISNPVADPNLAGKPVGPAFSAAWINDLVGRYGTASQGGVQIYELGNEPGLWNETHHDFHPNPLSFDELWAKSSALAQAVKDVDPTAQVLGPAEWGWPNYFCSTADVPDNGCFPESPDRAAHGGLDISAWYLQQFAQHQQQTGVRLLDYFDLHYYPQAPGGGSGYSPVTDVTRPLWDRTYRDPSWIDQKIYLLPRMRDWVGANYPGTKLAVTEYNMGLDVTSNKRLQNVIQADTLGIFGREGLDLATFWSQESSPVPEAAFKIFRNYDGKHHGFGDRGVSATSSAQGKLAVYAARRGTSGPMTIVVVNKTGGDLRSRLTLSHFAHARTAKPYRYAGSGIDKLGTVGVGSGGFTLTYPKSSITLVELKPA